MRFLVFGRGRLPESLVGRYLLDLGLDRPLRDTLALSSFQALPLDLGIQIHLLTRVYSGLRILGFSLLPGRHLCC